MIDHSSRIVSQNHSHIGVDCSATTSQATRALVPINVQPSSTHRVWANSVSSTPPTITVISRPSKSTTLPTQGLVIPNVPIRLSSGLLSPKEDSWRIIVDHWQKGDPSRGLTMPLKDWPDEWKQGKNKKMFAQKHFVRSVIAREFLET